MKWFLGIMMALLTLGLSCSNGDDKPIELHVGVVQSTSGAASSYGASAIRGIELAIKQLEGRENLVIEYTVLDDKSSAEGGKTAFATLSGQSVDAIIGPTLSGVALESHQISQAAGIPTIGATTTGHGITATGEYVFRTALAEDSVVPPVIAYVHAESPIQQAVLILDSRDDFSRFSAKAMKDGLQAVGASVLREIDVASTDYATALAEVRTAAFQALLVSPLVEVSGRVLQEIRSQGFTQPVIGGNGLNTLDIVGKSNGAVDGAYVGASWNPGATTDETRQFVADYRAAYNADPDLYAAQGYAAMQVLAAAAKDAGSSEPAKLRDALAAIRNVSTVFGAISMSDDREAEYSPVIQQFQDGKLVVVQ